MGSTAVVVALLLLVCSTVSSDGQDRTSECINSRDDPELSDGAVIEVFCRRIAAYVTLRDELQETLPPLRVTNDVAAIRNAVRALATAIRATRHRPREGGIFTSGVGGQVRTRLRHVVTDETCAAIRADNPGRLLEPVSQDYPEGKPLSTTPATVLASLPGLPPNIEYRFMGRDLILLDTRANIVIDRMVDAVRCGDEES
jgi:hypothetical protein